MIAAQSVRQHYGRARMLEGVPLAVAPGDVCALFERFGAGKSTFSRCISHIHGLGDGRLIVDVENLGNHERHGKLPRDAPAGSQPPARQTSAWPSSDCLFGI